MTTDLSSNVYVAFLQKLRTKVVHLLQFLMHHSQQRFRNNPQEANFGFDFQWMLTRIRGNLKRPGSTVWVNCDLNQNMTQMPLWQLNSQTATGTGKKNLDAAKRCLQSVEALGSLQQMISKPIWLIINNSYNWFCINSGEGKYLQSPAM